MEVGVYTSPLALLAIKDTKLREIIDNYLPYSIGIEIECGQSSEFNVKNFENIPYIIDVACDWTEQRFRIPHGLCGLICLYNICEQLLYNCQLNFGSGIHYHVDMTANYKKLSIKNVEENEKWILEELDTWEYKGTYNSRQVLLNCYHNWVRFQEGFKTAEFRIGEMSFDYKVLVKRIIHASNIVSKLIQNIGGKHSVSNYPEIDIELLKLQVAKNNTSTDRISYLINKLAALNDGRIEVDNNTMKQTINKRVIRI